MGYLCAERDSCINPIRNELNQQKKGEFNSSNSTYYNSSLEDMSVTTQTRDQIKSLLSQGFKISTEHANKRRFKTKSWLDGGVIQSSREDQVINQLQSVLNEYSGEYVRLVGIDPQAKRRVLEAIIQRPDGNNPSQISQNTTTFNTVNNVSSNGFAKPSNNGNGDLASIVQSFVNQGYKICIEHANKRRFKTKSWLTAGAIISSNATAAIREIQGILAQYPNEYVNLIAVDSKAKTRISETIIQRPGESANIGSSSNVTSSSSYSSSNNFSSNGSGALSGDIVSKIRSLLNQGCKIGTEHASKRHFKINSWKSCSPINSTREGDVIAALEACLQEHQGEYVKLIGIDAKERRRVLEEIIQRPGSAAKVSTTNISTTTSTPSSYSNTLSNSSLDAEIVNQVRSLLTQGYKITTEHADKRHFRAKSWTSCSPIKSTREGDVIAALEGCIQEHQGEYVRMIGIDTKARRRVSETIIQRP